jgi:hypothetical protein
MAQVLDQAWVDAAVADYNALRQYTIDNPQATQAQFDAWRQANPPPPLPPNEYSGLVFYDIVNGLPPRPPPPPPPEYIPYHELIPEQRYTLIIGYLPDNEYFAGNHPYNGIYVDFDYNDFDYLIFRDIRTARGILLAGDNGVAGGNKKVHVSTYAFVKYVPPPVKGPPKPWPQRNIPPNTDDVVGQEPITEGMDMVDFHGEYGFGRYYPLEVYNDLHNKVNPMTRQPIETEDLQFYTAHIAPAGGRRRRKTRKSKRRAKKTRRHK